MKGHILVVDDEAAIRDMIRTCLEMAGFKVMLCANGHLAQQMITQDPPSLIILDWMMPMLNGLELTRKLKREKQTASIPIIMLTAKEQEQDRVSGLDEGMDDYMTKPFSPRELVARVKAVLRRTQPEAEVETLSAGLLLLDSAAKTLSLNGQALELSPIEFRLLEFLMRHPNRVYSREQLLDQVWGHDAYIDERTVDVQIRRLRKAIAQDEQDQMIQTVRGSGYRFSPSLPA